MYLVFRTLNSLCVRVLWLKLAKWFLIIHYVDNVRVYKHEQTDGQGERQKDTQTDDRKNMIRKAD